MFGRKKKQKMYRLLEEYDLFVTLTRMMSSSIDKINALLKESDIKKLIDSGSTFNDLIQKTWADNYELMQETSILVELINRDYVVNTFVSPSVGLFLQTNINKFKMMVHIASKNFSVICSLVKIDEYGNRFADVDNDDEDHPKLALNPEKLINVLYDYLTAVVSAQLMLIDIGSVVFYEINKIDSGFDYIADYQNHKDDKFKSEHDEMSYKIAFMRNIDNGKEENKNAK